jgi:hypothetical protein
VRIDQRDETHQVGSEVQMTAQVSVPKETDRTIKWELMGNSSSETTLDADSGMLKIASDEQSHQLAVLAKLQAEPSQIDLVQVYIDDILKPDIRIMQDEQMVEVGSKVEFSAEVIVPKNKTSEIEWSISGQTAGGEEGDDKATSITADQENKSAQISIAKTEKANTLSVHACLKDYPEICSNALVFIDHSESLGYLQKTEELVKSTLKKLEGSIYSSEVWPIYRRNSNQPVALGIKNDMRTIAGVYLDGNRLDNIHFSTGGYTNFGPQSSNFALISPAYAATNTGEDSPNVNKIVDKNSNVVIMNPYLLNQLSAGKHTIVVKYQNQAFTDTKDFRIVDVDSSLSTFGDRVPYLLLMIALLIFVEVYMIRTRFLRRKIAVQSKKKKGGADETK